MSKLKKDELDKLTVRWAENLPKSWAQKVAVSRTKSSGKSLTNGAHQGSVLGPTPPFVSDSHSASWQIEHCEEWLVAYAAVLRVRRTSKWAQNGNLMNLEWKVLHQERIHTMNQHILVSDQLERISSEKDRMVLMDLKCQQHACSKDCQQPHVLD